MAQRMESIAPPGGVMLSESTAHLVRDTTILGEPETVRVKGDQVMLARQLLGIVSERDWAGRTQSTLVGREREVHTVSGILDRAISGRGSVVGVGGPPGIGKSRLALEAVDLAKTRGAGVFSTYCESHASQIPFHAVARMLRSYARIRDLTDDAARARLRAQMPDADLQDLALLGDMIGIADPGTKLPRIDPDARRRRLTALINTATLTRTGPALYVIEDAHWIDEVSVIPADSSSFAVNNGNQSRRPAGARAPGFASAPFQSPAYYKSTGECEHRPHQPLRPLGHEPSRSPSRLALSV
jgi:AAA ATPase domain